MFREHSMLVKRYSGARRTSLAFLEKDVALVRELHGKLHGNADRLRGQCDRLH